MDHKKPKTAEELMRELEADPEWLAKREERRNRTRKLRDKCAKDQSQMLYEIHALGYDIDTVWDFVNSTPHPFLERRFLGPYERAYPVLLRHLKLEHHPRVREGIIRSLAVKDGGPEVEEALLVELRREKSEELRWVLANALRTAMPYHRRKNYPEIKIALEQKGK